jgi:catechol 2,3-dioxygenase-like lactoylglutathione lyase family enzyme
MTIERLDHVNLRTAQLAQMRRWYEDVLGLVDGPRPPFGFGGAWLYAGEHALVHLVEVEATLDHDDLKLEHFAFSATDMDAFMARLEAHGVDSRVSPVPGSSIVQVNIWDPDGNHIHVDFEGVQAGSHA